MKSDIWSLGVLLSQMANKGVLPFDTGDYFEIQEAIKTGKHRKVVKGFSENFKNLLDSML